RSKRDWSSDVCSSDLDPASAAVAMGGGLRHIAEHCAVQRRTEQLGIGDGQLSVLDAAAQFQVFISHSFCFPPQKKVVPYWCENKIGRASCREWVVGHR